ncbi:hypothetical protein GCM10028796_21440 [Ramlibacter monticola]|uniref:Single-stranded DNA-binding protein n=1 Tax=Ramlibacter monticola TaxID=1926872 RepID=A0A936Z139_9BURK|nr:single-stranded DNA-binding protein [Ramlibacter monticola]MBL0392397.1 single-stranded DNA-binding protein [Ramlibacter monticola]
MTISALICGRLARKPEQRSGPSGRAYVLARLLVHDGDAQHFVSVFAFSEGVQRVLLALGEGASIAVSGALKAGIWTPERGGEPRVNLSLTADTITTLHEKRRTDRAVAEARESQEARHGERRSRDAAFGASQPVPRSRCPGRLAPPP